MEGNSRYKRRRVIGLIGTGTVVSVAGCLTDDTEDDGVPNDSDGTDDEPASGADDDGEEGTGEDDADSADKEGDNEETSEEAAFPADRKCAVCNMVAKEYPDWNAQLVHEDGHREFFCSAGCMAAYYAAPEEFDGPDTDVENVWVTDYETGELVDASDAVFVRVTDPDHVDDIMMRNPTPFADQSDAQAFVNEFDEYDEDDILDLEAFDRSLAEYYRGRFFEEPDSDDD
ncbi:NosL family protein [Natrialba magadii ATCC 43099]|uniref:Lipoprotein n=1 Tax=Natrialba magadii (strain ATCC 43099 / DSM 3394 / CCM 3739 / CIP 104546 / IAM 13178 / JCM 8861 / NBRC 102185 / NCIMB 2190 / MS3) TaxID=547559 RepID=D3T021_NATMM|nr:nitrous oxide reductase accessory protein NosL [Natrialba magadii]ADD04379.1 NosL family protein [Natrialba magadii ATCC 43099]ELY26020.1 lipoprotein [Natrialba magadii ATCC 43099]